MKQSATGAGIKPVMLAPFYSFLFLFVFVIGVRGNVVTTSTSPLDLHVGPSAGSLLGNADHVVIPIYNPKTQSIDPPVVVSDRAWIAKLAQVLKSAVYVRASHVLAVTAGGPITASAKDGQRLLTLEMFPPYVRVNGTDYEVGKKTCDAIAALLAEKRPESPKETRR